MFSFAIKNMAVKKLQVLLVTLSVVLSCGVGVLAYNISEQVNDGIVRGAGYYSAIIGPSGSSTQLAMNTMYFTDSPLGTIPYQVVTDLSADMRVSQVIPYAMADQFNGSPVVGTAAAYLAGKEVCEGGRLFADDALYEIVLGYRLAKQSGAKVGDTVYTGHSAAETHNQPFTVVGILEETHSSYDMTAFTELRTLWSVHEDHDEHEEGHDEGHEENVILPAADNALTTAAEETPAPADAVTSADTIVPASAEPSHSHGEEHGGEEDHDHGDENHEGEEDHDHEHEHMEGMICAVLVKTKNPAMAMSLISEYNEKTISESGKTYALSAIDPMNAVRGVLDDADRTQYIVFALCAIILLMNIMIISIITLLNMYHSAKEISLMRLIGISMRKINRLYLIQNGLIGIVSVGLAFLLSRLCLNLAGDYVASMGVVLDMSVVYPLEWVILGVVFAITVLPTVICTFVMAHRDGLSD